MGDFMIVIEWTKKERALKNFVLRPIYEEVVNIADLFPNISFFHIY